MTAARYLYLARHAEAAFIAPPRERARRLPDESGLSESGERQAALLGERLRAVPLTGISHGPLARATRTARIVADAVGGPVEMSPAAGDYVPHVPARAELPAELADVYLGFLSGVTAAEREEGDRLAKQALADFTGPVEGDAPVHELVVTHAYLVGWLVRAALDAPPWRWLGINAANAGLTVIRYAPGRASSVLVLNDQSHLPPELRWTGFPAELRG